MTLSRREIELLKCMYNHGYYQAHHKSFAVIQNNCNNRVRKGLRKKLNKLVNAGYVWHKGSMQHLAVTPEGRDFLIEIGELTGE
jgi:hypothetical protein